MIPTPVVRKINQEKNPNKGIEKFETTEKISSLSDRTDSVIKNNAEAKDKLKRGIPVLKTRSKNKMRTSKNLHFLVLILKIRGFTYVLWFKRMNALLIKICLSVISRPLRNIQ